MTARWPPWQIPSLNFLVYFTGCASQGINVTGETIVITSPNPTSAYSTDCIWFLRRHQDLNVLFNVTNVAISNPSDMLAIGAGDIANLKGTESFMFNHQEYLWSLWTWDKGFPFTIDDNVTWVYFTSNASYNGSVLSEFRVEVSLVNYNNPNVCNGTGVHCESYTYCEDRFDISYGCGERCPYEVFFDCSK